MPLTEATFTRVTDFQGIEVDAAISPDGKFVAFLSDRSGPVDVWVTQVGSGAFVNLTNGRFPELLHEEMQSVGFTGDGTHVWFRVSEGNQIWIIPALGGAGRPLLQHGQHPVWSPDGQQLVYSVPSPEIGEPLVVADANGGNPRQFYKGQSGAHSHFLAWSKDGRTSFSPIRCRRTTSGAFAYLAENPNASPGIRQESRTPRRSTPPCFCTSPLRKMDRVPGCMEWISAIAFPIVSASESNARLLHQRLRCLSRRQVDHL